MPSTFFGLETARSGLSVAQTSLNVTGHNISNADTEGYTRQRLSTSAIAPATLNVAIAVEKSRLVGQGVKANYVEQIRNSFLDSQYRQETSESSMWQTKSDEFSMVESLFNNELETSDTSTSLSSAFSDFYASLYDLSEDPSSLDVRVSVKENAAKLAETFNYYYTQLQQQHDDMNESVSITVGQINDLTDEIASLNGQIYAIEMGGGAANDLNDSRNLLLDELSEKIPITYYNNSKGQLVIELDGKELVNSTTANKLDVANTGTNQMTGQVLSQYEVVWADDSSEVNVTGGSLKAYLDMRDGSDNSNKGIPYVANQLNELARKVAKDVNTVNQNGYTMPYNDGTSDIASQKGVLFFDDGSGDYANVTAETICLSNALKESECNIAASSVEVSKTDAVTGTTDDNEQRGNNDNVEAMIELITKKDSLGNQDNFDSVLNSIVVDVGVEMQHIDSRASAANTLQAQIDDQRSSVSEVSLDEEMTNMVRYTHSYNAAARMITAIDEQMDTMINKMGRVGL